VQELKANGTILGALPEITIHRAYAQIQRNAVLVMYSDGIFERLNRNEEQFGIPRLKKLVLKNQNRTAQEIMDLIFNTVFDYGQGKNWEDDATVVVIKRVGEAK
jgi:sigma-B regulation protein RsbU (phosphoserine phosphatase)